MSSVSTPALTMPSTTPQPAPAAIADLPVEVIHQILSFAPAQATIALQQTSKHFSDICDNTLLWRHHCLTKFSAWEAHHEIAKKKKAPVATVDWKRLYLDRVRKEQRVNTLLDEILACQSGRLEKYEEITAMGYDAKNTLLEQASVPREEGNGLARRYYANHLLAGAYRRLAIQEWDRIREGADLGLERALALFDMMVSWDKEKVTENIVDRLDQIATDVPTTIPEINELTPRRRASAIAQWLLDRKLVGMDDERNYHNIEHNFIGFSLFSKEHNSLPLVSCAIFCYVARKYGLDASLCGFPLHIVVIIRSSDMVDLDGRPLSTGSPRDEMYMDPYRNSSETSIADLRSQLQYIVSQPQHHASFLQPASTIDIITRCARNIRNSAENAADSYTSPIDLDSVKYAGAWAHILFGTPPLSAASTVRPPLNILREVLPALLEQFVTNFTSDIALVEKYTVPLFRGLDEYEPLREAMRSMRVTDKKSKQARRRDTLERQNVRYTVGEVFQHKRYGYYGAIIGWDVKCEAGSEWEQHNAVSRLTKGPAQSFYHTLAQDKTIRYVAEENVTIVAPDDFEFGPAFPDYAGRYFKRWDRNTHRFISNVMDEYPDN